MDVGHRRLLGGEHRRVLLIAAVVVVLAVIAGGFALTRLNRAEPQAGTWHAPLWPSWSAASVDDVCTVGVCVADTVALPLARPVEAVADLTMPEELGALSVERVWTGERSGMFGPGWETVWDVRLNDGLFVGPLPAKPVEAPRNGHRVKLEGGSTVQVDDQGRLDEVCLDAASCTKATWSDDTLVLQPTQGSAEDGTKAAKAKVTFSLDDGVVSRAKSDDGRTVEYRYTSGRLASVTQGEDKTDYAYEAGRLSSIDDGVRRTFSYDRSGRVFAATDLDGGRWTINRLGPGSGSAGSTGATGRAIEVTSPDGWTRTYRFTRGLLVEVVDSDLGVMLRREVDGSRVVLEERPIEGVRSEWLAADELRVDQQQDGGPTRTARFWFDAAGRVARTETADGPSDVSYEGQSGRPAEIRGPGGTQTFDYDQNGLLLATEDADGYRVEVERNAAGQPVVVSDGMQRTKFAYDAAGRVNQESSGDATSSATYGPDGLLASLTSPSGDKLAASYDDHGRLQALGGADAEPTKVPETELPAAPASPAEPAETVKTVERSDGGFEQSYPSGETVLLDKGGRPTEVTVNGRTESRRYDEAGRLVELNLQGGPTYEVSYTAAGRVASVTDGAVTTDLEWHGDLLLSLETSAGTSYHYDYDEAGQTVSATSGPLSWDYTYDAAGRSSVVRGPSGVVQSQWDDQGRPVEVRDGGHTETYGWAGDGLDLVHVDIDDEEVFGFQRDDAGKIVEVTEADLGTAKLGYDPTTGALNRYRVGDSDELTLDYDEQGQVVGIESGDRTENWTWSGGEVVKVDVAGEDEPYQLAWLAPGLLGNVEQGGDQLLRTKVDDAGRPTKLWTGDDLAATLSWGAAGLAEASIEDGSTASFERDDEHRLVGVEVGDQRVDWAYDGGALTSIHEGDRATSFVYSEGRLKRTIHADGDDESAITWDPVRARPKKIVTPRSDLAFEYKDDKVASIQIDGDDRPVTYEDGQPTAKGDAGDVLDALFSDSGRYQSTIDQSTLGPAAPWIESLPDELGVALPEVITGRQIVDTAIDNQIPTVPSFLVEDAEDLAERTALGLAAATAGAPVLAGPDQLATLGLEVEKNDLTLDFAGPVDATTVTELAGIFAPEPGVLESVVDFGQDVVGAVASGISGGFRSVQRFVTQTSVGNFISTLGFMALSRYVLACGAAGAAAGIAAGAPLGPVGGVVGAKIGFALGAGVCAAGLRVAEALLTAQPGQPLVATVTDAVFRPVKDFAQAIKSRDALGITLSVAEVAGPLVRRLRPQALSAVCGLRRMVCVSAARYGPEAQHVADAQRNGSPRLLVLGRSGSAARRSSALRNLTANAGLDRYEQPFTHSSRRNALSVQYIDPASNRALGSYVGNKLRAVPDDAYFYVLPIA